MKPVLVLFTLMILVYSCTNPKTKIDIVNEFYKTSNAYNFKSLKRLTYDTVTIIDGKTIMEFDRNSYYTIFQWDSVFKPNYTLVMSEQAGDDVFVKVSTTSKRFEFLDNNPLVSTHKISFKGDKISRIELIEYVETDFKKWVVKRDSLINWIKENQPQLNGFVFDMTKTGAEKYLKAIELYNSSNNPK